jgi:tRNA (pseudouridine54-N1)-methyltransferase
MRRFLLLAHRVPVDGAFTLNDLAGGAGRMDEVARAVSTAFTLSNDLRRDTEMTILFVAAPPPAARFIRITGARLKFLNPDERSTAALLKNALTRSLLVDHPFESSPGITVGPGDPPSDLRRFLKEPGAFWLTEDGADVRATNPGSSEFAAVLSDPDNPTAAERQLLAESGVPSVRLGPRSLRCSQCIDVLHNEFDRRERETAPPRTAPAGSTVPG